MTAPPPSTPNPSGISKRKVLIVGVDSVIGAALDNILVREGYLVIGSTRRLNEVSADRLYINLEDTTTFTTLELHKFDTAVICGAVTSLQVCEANPSFSKKVNVDGTIKLANTLAKAGAHLIFLSTNMVFDGSKPNFLPDDVRSPLTEYGKQKAEVESWLVSENPAATIIRFGKVLPPHFPLFAQWRKQLLSGNPIRPHANKSIAPISLEMAIIILSWLVGGGKPGIFQATANSDITYSEAALYIAHRCNANPSLVKPANSQDQSGDGKQFTPINNYNTLQISPCFATLFGNFSPFEAVHYSLQSKAPFAMESY